MSIVRVKICGITSVDAALQAINAGADAIGLVFYKPSPRCIDVKTAAAIARHAGPFVTVTGLFVNASVDDVNATLADVPLNLLQFHGEETPDYCSSFERPYMKALRVRPELDVAAEIRRYERASGVLLDAYVPGVPGGTGACFDWQRVPKDSSLPLVLAGGLTPENVAEAVAATHVNAVDVSGGVESAPGQKDPALINKFIRCARSAT